MFRPLTPLRLLRVNLRLRARQLMICATFLVATLGVTFTATQPASALNYWTASGTIACQNGSAVEGVWVSAGTASGWATMTNYRGVVEYNRGLGLAHPTYQLSVGCGGSPQHWAQTDYDNQYLVSNESMVVVCGGGACYGVDFDG
jgi:hypothetical protein